MLAEARWTPPPHGILGSSRPVRDLRGTCPDEAASRCPGRGGVRDATFTADFPAGCECNSSVSREGVSGGGDEGSGEVQLKCWRESLFQQCLGV